MPIKSYKPTSPGRRGMTVSTFEEITRDAPEKSLLRPIKKRAGRNFRGKITVRRRGGGHKRRYRVIDFKRDKAGIPARVHRLSMTRIGLPGLLCWYMPTVRSDTSLPRWS